MVRYNNQIINAQLTDSTSQLRRHRKEPMYLKTEHEEKTQYEEQRENVKQGLMDLWNINKIS